MRKDTYVAEHTIPAQTTSENIIAITIYPNNKNFTILTDTTDVSVNNTVNIQSILDLMTDQQKNIVKIFLKKCGALRLDADEIDIIGEIF